MATCFVIQPFDKGGPFDKRYDEIIAPSIEAAGLNPYRVDRDLRVEVPIEDIERGIQSSIVCLADISTNSPNVWYEVGYARAQSAGLVMICSEQRAEPFPFDVQHRTIVRYNNESPSSFTQMGEEITARLAALAEKQTKIAVMKAERERAISIEAPQPEGQEGLPDSHVAVLIIVLGHCPLPEDSVAGYAVVSDMEKAGYTKAMSSLAIRHLIRNKFIETFIQTDYNNNEYSAIRMTNLGENWTLSHPGRFAAGESAAPIELDMQPAIDDLPF